MNVIFPLISGIILPNWRTEVVILWWDLAASYWSFWPWRCHLKFRWEKSLGFLVVFFWGKSDPWILQKVGRLEIELIFVDQLGSLFSIEGASWAKLVTSSGFTSRVFWSKQTSRGDSPPVSLVLGQYPWKHGISWPDFGKVVNGGNQLELLYV